MIEEIKMLLSDQRSKEGAAQFAAEHLPGVGDEWQPLAFDTEYTPPEHVQYAGDGRYWVQFKRER